MLRSLADDVKKELEKYDKLPPPCVTTDVLVPGSVVIDVVWMDWGSGVVAGESEGIPEIDHGC